MGTVVYAKGVNEQQQKTRYECVQVSTMVKYYVWEKGGGATEEVQSEHKPERYL